MHSPQIYKVITYLAPVPEPRVPPDCLPNLIIAFAGFDTPAGTPDFFGDCVNTGPAEPWFAGFFPPLNDFILLFLLVSPQGPFFVH
jgi:hypothetical protein